VKKTFFLLTAVFQLFGFEVEFTKIYKDYVVPDQEAQSVCTNKHVDFPFRYIKQGNCYILLGDQDAVSLWLENDFYPPKDAIFKKIKIKTVDFDQIQKKVIQQVKQRYSDCNIKHLIFLTPDEEKVITKPSYIKAEYKVILECK